jgi:hypothetical protein
MAHTGSPIFSANQPEENFMGIAPRTTLKMHTPPGVPSDIPPLPPDRQPDINDPPPSPAPVPEKMPPREPPVPQEDPPAPTQPVR